MGEKNKEVAILKYRDAWVIQYDIEQCERENGLSQEEKDFKLAHKKKKKNWESCKIFALRAEVISFAWEHLVI